MEGKSYALIEPVTKKILTMKGGKIKIGNVGEKPLLFRKWLNCQEVRDDINKELATAYKKKKAAVSPNFFNAYEVNKSGYVHMVERDEWLYVGGVA